MISRALQHCYGVGPIRMKKLHQMGIFDWHDVLRSPQDLSIEGSMIDNLIAESQRCLFALQNDQIHYFTENFDPGDQWRILSHYFDRLSFVDIETTGLAYNDYITVITAYHKGEIHYFFEDENLDDFLDLMDDMDLMVTFNGSSFDLPRIMDCFHIPEIPCPHLDLRWICYHKNLRGGLKNISYRLGIRRPWDIENVDGEEAIYLWEDWTHMRDQQALLLLRRYCAADVLLLYMMAIRLLEQEGVAIANRIQDFELWEMLPSA